MGGGGAMKAAAKAVGFTAMRGIPSENQVRSAARQIPAMFSTSNEVSVGEHAAEKVGMVEVGEEKSCLEFGDWDFVGGEEKVLKGGMGRVVFGGKPPTLEEAKDATAELKEALDKTFMSSPSVPVWGLSSISSPKNTKIIDRVTSDGTPSVPKNALNAFTLLSCNPAAQTVVASIACDPNVWSAVLQNEALVEFLQSNTPKEDSELNTNFFFKSSTSSQFSDYGVLKESLQTIKIKVVDMVTNFTEYFSDLFAVEEKSPKKAEIDDDDISKIDIGKLMGLVVLVIAVMFVKRG